MFNWLEFQITVSCLSLIKPNFFYGRILNTTQLWHTLYISTLQTSKCVCKPIFIYQAKVFYTGIHVFLTKKGCFSCRITHKEKDIKESIMLTLSTNTQTILAGMSIGLLVYYVIKRMRYRLPPGPWCIPLVGHYKSKEFHST